MRSRAQPPVPPERPAREPHDLSDAEDKPAQIKDMRKRFARVSEDAGRDPEAERAFVESKIQMIRSHPTLTEPEKRAAIAEVEERLRGKP
jgi:hypothetical protein